MAPIKISCWNNCMFVLKRYLCFSYHQLIVITCIPEVFCQNRDPGTLGQLLDQPSLNICRHRVFRTDPHSTSLSLHLCLKIPEFGSTKSWNSFKCVCYNQSNPILASNRAKSICLPLCWARRSRCPLSSPHNSHSGPIFRRNFRQKRLVTSVEPAANATSGRDLQRKPHSLNHLCCEYKVNITVHQLECSLLRFLTYGLGQRFTGYINLFHECDCVLETIFW